MNKRTEEKLKSIEGMKKAMTEILAQAWERGHKMGMLQAQEAEKQAQWIPCDEMMPKIATKCLVTLSNGYITIGEYFSIEKWTLIDTSLAYVYPKETVVAWMPLPKPYTKEEDT